MEAKLIVFAGPPCSGKTALAERISRTRGISHLQMDETRARLMPESLHTRADRAVAYRAMAFAAELLLANGLSVILDAPYGHPEDRHELAQIASKTGARLCLIECHVAPETALERFQSRAQGPRLDLTPEKVVEMAANYPYTGQGLTLNTGELEFEECVARIERFLN